MNILEIKSVSMWFSGLRALNDINFSVESDKIISVIGPNGAGKTTLFNCITGFVPPSEGSIIFNGHSIEGLTPHKVTAGGMARTFQSIRLFSEMTALENVMVGGHSRTSSGVFGAIFQTASTKKEESDLRETAAGLLSFVGLKGKEQDAAVNLSYGDQRRLEIARALAIDPKLLLLDEPAAGMNPSETAALVGLIRQVNDRGITILLIEHDMKLVMNISDHIIVLDHGEKIADGTSKEVQTNKAVIEAYLGVGADYVGAE